MEPEETVLAELLICPEMFLTGYNIGDFVCYDVEFPGAVRALALAGATLIVVPTAFMEPYCWIAQLVVPARAYENQVFVVYANRCGREADFVYCGLSCIVGPDGHDLIRAGTEEGLFVVDINLEAIAESRSKNPYLADLCPEQYKAPVR